MILYIFLRWVRFEEDVEEGANRWSKPHVSSLSLHSLMKLRTNLQKGAVFLEMEANSLEDIVDLFLEHLLNHDEISYDKIKLLKELFLTRHRHQGGKLLSCSHVKKFGQIADLASDW